MSASFGPVSPGQRYKRGSPCPVCGGYDTLRRGRGIRCSGYASPDGKMAFCTREEYAGDLAAPIPNAPLPTWAHWLAGSCKCGRDHAHQAPEQRQIRGDHQGERRGFAGPPRQGETLYNYTDVGGAILYQVRRVVLPEGGKTFYQVHHERARGGWVYGRGDASLVLYRLPVIADASPETPIFYCEGEKDAEALERLGLVATCNAGGALKNADAWRAEYGEALRDRPVIILQDNDIPGAHHAEIARNALYGLARSVKVLAPFGAAPGYDVSDWLAEGNGKEQLLALAEQTPAWAPETGEALLSLYARQHAAEIKPEALEGALAAIRASLAEHTLPEGEALLCDLARALLDYTTRAIDTLRAAPVPLHPGASAGRDLTRGERGRTLRAMLARLQRSARRAGLALLTADIERAWREALQGVDSAIIRKTRQAPEGEAITREPARAPDNVMPLVSVAAGDIYLIAEGLYLQGAKRGRLLLGAPVRPLLVASGDNASHWRMEITPSAGEAIIITANDREIEKGACWRNLDGRVSPLPSSQGEYDALYAALRALAVQQETKVQALVSSLAWQQYNGRLVWVASNGIQDGASLVLEEEAPLFVTLPQNARRMFALPETSEAPSVAPLRELLQFWRKEQTLFSYAALGYHAQVMKPLARADAGTLDFSLEPITKTGEGKSANLNWMHRAFLGSGFVHDTPTLLNDNGLTKDTGIASARLRSKLRYHVYQTADRNAQPGNVDYIRQQAWRVSFAMSIGNKDEAGIRSQRESKDIESRGEPVGAPAGAGEYSPYEYTTTVGALDADARMMTFFIPVSPLDESLERIERSKRVGREGAALDALAVAWRAYLMAEQAELNARDADYRAEAAKAFALAVDVTGGRVHTRASGKVQQTVSGLREYARFLSLSGITGAAGLAADIEATIPLLIAERAEAEARLWALHNAKGTTPEQSQAEQALDAIRALLFSAHAHLTDKRQQVPEDIGALLPGHINYTHIGIRQIAGEWRQQGVTLGWIEPGIIYLIPGVLFPLLRKARLALAEQERHFYDVLESAGYLAATGGDKTTRTRRGLVLDKNTGQVEQGIGRALALRPEALYPSLDTEAEQAPEITHQNEQDETPGGDRPAEQPGQPAEGAPEIALAAPSAPLWCIGKHWFNASRVDSAASQALEWACPSIPIAAHWLTSIVTRAFATGAPLAGVQVNGRPVSPDRFLALLHQAYEDNNRGMLANLARSVGADLAGVLPPRGDRQGEAGEPARATRAAAPPAEIAHQGEASGGDRPAEATAKRLAISCGAALSVYDYADPRQAGMLRPVISCPVPPSAGLGDLARLAISHNADTLWLLPLGASPRAEGNAPIIRTWGEQMQPEALQARYPEYAWQPLTSKGPGAGGMLAGYKCGYDQGGRAGVLWIQAAWLAWSLIGDLSALPEGEGARADTLASAIALAGILLGTRQKLAPLYVHLRVSPSRIGRDLITRHLWHFHLSEAEQAPLPGEIAEQIRAHLPASPLWRRAPLPGEGESQGEQVRVYKYDRNWSYVSSARRAPVGAPHPTIEYMPGVPGFYRLASASAPDTWPIQAPGLFMVGEGIGEYPQRVAETWAWAPQIELALRQGWRVEIAEGWYWTKEQTHELFRTWQADMWAGVHETRRLQREAPEIALAAHMAEACIKHIGRAAIGRLKMTPGVKVVSRAEAEAEGLPILRAKVDAHLKETGLVEVSGALPEGERIQPQWWAQVIAGAGERLQAAMCTHALADTVMLYTDALYTLAPHPELETGADKIGGWKLDGCGWVGREAFTLDAVKLSGVVKAAIQAERRA